MVQRVILQGSSFCFIEPVNGAEKRNVMNLELRRKLLAELQWMKDTNVEGYQRVLTAVEKDSIYGGRASLIRIGFDRNPVGCIYAWFFNIRGSKEYADNKENLSLVRNKFCGHNLGITPLEKFIYMMVPTDMYSKWDHSKKDVLKELIREIG